MQGIKSIMQRTVQKIRETKFLWVEPILKLPIMLLLHFSPIIHLYPNYAPFLT